MNLILNTLLLIGFYKSLPLDGERSRQTIITPATGVPLSRFPQSTGTHLGNRKLLTIAKTDKNPFGDSAPVIDLNYGIFVENLGEFLKFNLKDGVERDRVEKMIKEQRKLEDEQKDTESNIEEGSYEDASSTHITATLSTSTGKTKMTKDELIYIKYE
jgi:hypothetical protein